MKNIAFYVRPAGAIDLKHETIKRVAEEWTHDCMREIDKAMGPCCLQEVRLPSAEEQAR